MTYEIRYSPGSDLGRRYPNWVIVTAATRQDAERIRRECPNGAVMEIREVGK